MSSSEAATVINDDRLFVSAEFTLMRLGARGVDSNVSQCYCCVCWRCARVVEGADCNSAHVGSSPTSVSGAASPRQRRVAGVVELACATYPRRPTGKTADFGSANTGSSPVGDAIKRLGARGRTSRVKWGVGREAYCLWVVSMRLWAI